MENTLANNAPSHIADAQTESGMELTIALVLHGMDLAYADDAQGNRFYLDIDSEGVPLSSLRGGSKIKARGVEGAWIGSASAA